MKKLLFFIAAFIPSITFAGITTKTIEYSLKQSTGFVAGHAVRTWEPLTVQIPETTSRKFVDVTLFTHFQDSTTVATSPTAITHGLKIDSVATSSITVTDTLTNSGENMSFMFISTYTAYFETNFTGTSHTLNLTSMVTVSTTNNCSAKLVITYEHDDSETTQIKTVRIPLQGSTGTLTTSMLKIDSIPSSPAQIPALDTWLPEQSKTIRDIFFEINVNDSVTAATGSPPQMGLKLDSETEVLDADHSMALISARRYYRIWKRTDMDTSTTHDLYARTTNTNMGFNVMSVLLTVTYEYNVNTSTEIMNSIVLPIGSNDTVAGGSTYAQRSTIVKRFTIPEANPVLANSGLVMFTNDQNTPSVFLRSGSQVVYSSYTFPAISACGDKTLSHRIDRDNGFSIRKGTNTYILQFFRNGTTPGNLGSYFWGSMYLNYRSSTTAVEGRDANLSKTLFYGVIPYQPDVFETISPSTAPVIRPSNYNLTGVGFVAQTMRPAFAGPNACFLKVSIASDTIDATNAGYFSDLQNFAGEGEFGPYTITHDLSEFFKRNQYDSNQKLDLEVRRIYSVGGGGEAIYGQGYLFFTVHSVTFTVAGTISGYTGDGSGIDVNIYNAITDEFIAHANTSTGGTFSIPVYSDAVDVYASAYQDSTHKGLSAVGTPGTSTFNIDFSGGAPASQTFGTIFFR